MNYFERGVYDGLIKAALLQEQHLYPLIGGLGGAGLGGLAGHLFSPGEDTPLRNILLGALLGGGAGAGAGVGLHRLGGIPEIERLIRRLLEKGEVEAASAVAREAVNEIGQVPEAHGAPK